MKKEMSRREGKDQAVWEEFVFKNSIKKKFQLAAAIARMM